jgi:transcriptional regulator with XRE-family HTH domain
MQPRPRFEYRNLAAYLAGSGDTQAHLAIQVGVSRSYLSRLVAGQNIPRADIALRIANYARIDPQSFAICHAAYKRTLGRRRRRVA